MSHEEPKHQPFILDVIDGPDDELITHWTIHLETTDRGPELVYGPETQTRAFWRVRSQIRFELERRLLFGPDGT